MPGKPKTERRQTRSDRGGRSGWQDCSAARVTAEEVTLSDWNDKVVAVGIVESHV